MAEVDGGDILIRIRGDASDLEDAINRSQGAISGLESGADDAADVLGSMGSAAKKTSGSLKNLARDSLPAISAGISTVNPAAGAMVGLFGQLAAVAGPLALAVGAVTAAFALYKHEAEKAAEAAERAKERIEDFNDAFTNQAVIAEDLRNELRLIQGEIDKEGLAHEKRKTRIQAAGDAVVASLDEQIEAQQKLVDQATGPNARISKKQQEEAAALTTELDRLKQERIDTIEVTKNHISVAEQIAEFHRLSKEAEEDLGAATRATTVAIEEQTAALILRNTVYGESIQITNDVRPAPPVATAEEIQEEMDRSETVIEKFNRINADREKKHKEDTTALAAETQAERVEFALSANDQIGQAAGEFASVMADKNKKAALIAYRVSQASGIVEATISTSKSVAKALELGPFFGPPAAAVMGALGAAQIATIAATPPPTAHIGTGMPGSRDPLAPDERMSNGRRVLTTEASGPGGVANSMGTQLLNDVNTGRVQSSGRITAVIGRSHLDQELFRSGRRGTSRYARSLRTNPHPKPQGGY